MWRQKPVKLKDIHFLMPKGGRNFANCQGFLGSFKIGPIRSVSFQ